MYIRKKSTYKRQLYTLSSMRGIFFSTEISVGLTGKLAEDVLVHCVRVSVSEVDLGKERGSTLHTGSSISSVNCSVSPV